VVTEKYFYKTAFRKHYLTLLIASLLYLFLPIIRIEIETPAMWFGTYLCEGKMADYIKQLADGKKVGLEIKVGNMEKFFQCEDTTSLEKWVGLQEISLMEMLKKVIYIENNENKELKVFINRIMSEGSNKESRPVAMLILKAWKGCRIVKRLRRDDRRGYRIETDAKRWRVVSVFMFGIREYIDVLKQRIEMATRPATMNNLLCFEEQSDTTLMVH